MTYAIQAEDLAKRFKETRAPAGVDLAARTGTVLGLLGPNGAGEDDGGADLRHTAPAMDGEVAEPVLWPLLWASGIAAVSYPLAMRAYRAKA
ncbi:hypothetical protein QFZ67_003076 [Streptomyces sp. V1I1]|nr:hypothetical protein [Streptomyces sp. V1I1]